MKAIILARVSTEEQKDAGNSLPAQIKRQEEYCRRKGYEVTKERIFSFSESAYKTKRDELDKVLEFLKTIDEKVALCFDKVDRFSRNVFDKRVATLYDLAMEDKVELHFASDNLVINNKISATEKFQFGINLGLAKYYSDAISDNVKRAFETKLRNGEWCGKAPIGYINKDLENGKKTIVPDPDRAYLITKAFEWYASGNYSFGIIKGMLEKAGLTSNTKQQKTLTKSSVAGMFKNPFYYGRMLYDGKIYDHKYEPLISKWVYDRCQEISGSRKTTKFKYKSKPFIFRGLLACSQCGCTISSDIKKNKYVYLSCSHYKGNCDQPRIKQEVVLDQVRAMLKSIKIPEAKVEEIKADLKKSFDNEQKFNKRAIESIRKETDQLQSELRTIVELRAKGSITINEADKMIEEIKQKQLDLNLQAEDHIKADKEFIITTSYLLELASRASELFESSKEEQKRKLLNILLSNSKLEGEKLVFNLKTPFDVIARCSKSSNWLPGLDSNQQPSP